MNPGKLITTKNDSVDISVIIPFFNEEKSLTGLYEKIIEVFNLLQKSVEILFIDDGSEDHSFKIVSMLRKKDKRVKIIRFQNNLGKAHALNEGFLHASGAIIITMDADLQDDPMEIPRFLEKIEEGFDLVSGWKKKRHDPIEKRVPSKFFNYITSLVTGLKLHDFNCGFKAYKKNVIEDINIYGALHRYIPALVHYHGYKVCEIPVHHHERPFGESKYGWERYFQGFFDLFTVVLLTRFLQRPVYLFGITGSYLAFSGILIMVFLSIVQVLYGTILGNKPLSYFGVLFVLFGSQLIATGLIADMLNNLKGIKKERDLPDDSIPVRVEPFKFDLSIVILIKNKFSDINSFLEGLELGLSELNRSVEIILVDAGSGDESSEQLAKYQKITGFKTRMVKSGRQASLSVSVKKGVSLATGSFIIVIPETHINNLPHIPLMINELESKSDLVVDSYSIITFQSRLFLKFINRLVSFLTRGKVSILGKGLKSFRKEIIPQVKFIGESQFLFHLSGQHKKCKERETKLHDNKNDRPYSSYTVLEATKTLLDILSMVLLTDYKARPLHMFGLIGGIISSFGFCIIFYLLLITMKHGNVGGHYTLLLVGVTFMLLGLQWFSTGLLAEIINNIKQIQALKNHLPKNDNLF